MEKYILQPGDMIRVNRLIYNHVGIYVGRRFSDERIDGVIHNDKFGGVVVSTLADFSCGAAVQLHKPATGDYFEREAIVERAFSLIGQKFDLLKFNCEHAANWAQTGKSESPQLRGAIALAALFCGFAVLFRSK
jgi:hypothetical protein